MDHSSFTSISFDAYDESHSRANPNTITNRAIKLIEACGFPLPGSDMSKTVFLALVVASSVVSYIVAELYTSWVLYLSRFERAPDSRYGVGELSYGQLWSVGGIWLAVTLTTYRVLAFLRRMRRKRAKVHYHVC
ncbi:hypothetical protein CkaCkLH20_09608 [Colletotrichum karsti]|uniref:Uncharacterized protein n=1 Tax=Colletotrichum karsti TaxID=1095194 RepID=A0A9P6LHM2_9PEZI|nr:uncharacterized protein CkaCkLH20_09608 [Colletotrichum karsti]KAF9872745.1 hypothetical protein CkaCkLH20_09608 [Colletotrichum karsti]